MARMRCDFFSESLGMGTSMTVLLPERITEPPVLYLLHALGDDDTAPTRRTGIERYADEQGLAVVMPQVHRSFYTDEAQGNRYWTFLSGELPALVERFFRLSRRREDTYVAGFSMGGYGAFKWALRQPQRFAAAASLSGVLDIPGLVREGRPDDPRFFQRIFGEAPVSGTPDDVLSFLDGSADLPRLYACCGTEDFNYHDNLKFREACRANGVDLVSEFGQGGHDWAYWDTSIRRVLMWMLDRE